MLSRKSRGSECLGRRATLHCNSLREAAMAATLNPEEIPLTSLRMTATTTTSDDTDQDDSPYRRPLFDTNERRRPVDANRLSKWCVFNSR